MVSPPELLDVVLIPPGLGFHLGGEASHFVKGFIEKRDIRWVDDGALEDGGILKHDLGINGVDSFEAVEHLFFNDGDAFFTESFAKAAQS